MTSQIICAKVAKQPLTQKLEATLRRHPQITLSIKKEYIYLQFTETAELAMLDQKNTQQVLQELSDEPFEILGHPQNFQKEAQACPLQLSSSSKTIVIPLEKLEEAQVELQTNEKQEKSPIVQIEQSKGSNLTTTECWNSGQADCQFVKKQLINLEQFSQLSNEETTCLKVEFEDSTGRSTQEAPKIQQKEQTKIQAIMYKNNQESNFCSGNQNRSFQQPFVLQYSSQEEEKSEKFPLIQETKTEHEVCVPGEIQVPSISKLHEPLKEEESSKILFAVQDKKTLNEPSTPEILTSNVTQRLQENNKINAPLTFLCLVLCFWMLFVIVY